MNPRNTVHMAAAKWITARAHVVVHNMHAITRPRGDKFDTKDDRLCSADEDIHSQDAGIQSRGLRAAHQIKKCGRRAAKSKETKGNIGESKGGRAT